MIFEIILLRIAFALLICFGLFWLGAIFWRTFNKNKKFDKFAKTINEQPAEEETPAAEVPDTDAPVGTYRVRNTRKGANTDQPEG